MNRFIALDFETADRGQDSACAIGVVCVEDHHIVHREHRFIRPPRKTFEFSYIHGIEWSDVANEPTFGQLWPILQPLITQADFIAAHNAPFDQRVLYACCDAHGIARPAQKFVCTVKLARQTWNLHPTKLPNVCEYLGIALTHHQALSDAEACARIVIAADQHLESTSLAT